MKRSTVIILALSLMLSLASGPRPAAARDKAVSETRKTQQTEKDKKQAAEQEKTGEATRAQNLEVVVTAPRMDIPLKQTPAATTVLEETALENMPRSVAAEEALRLAPGVKVDNQADGERVHLSIRGQGILTERGIRGIRVNLDGLPLNDPTGFAPDLFDVDWSTVRRIEVFRGPAGSLYGASSSGGVINIETRDGGPQTIAGRGFLSVGSYNFWKAQAEAGGTSGALNYRVSGGRTWGNGYRVHTNFWADNFYGKFRWQVSPSFTLTAIAGWTEYFNQNPEGLNIAQVRADPRQPNPDALTFNEYQDTRRVTSGLTGRWDIASGQALSFAAYFRNTLYKEPVPSSVQHRRYSTPGFSLEYRADMGSGWLRNEVVAGADVQWQGIDAFSHPNLGDAVEGPVLLSDQTINQRGIGVFLVDRVGLGEHWGLVFSLRRDDIDNELSDKLKAGGVDLSGEESFRKVTGRVGLTWNPVERFGMYASWGTGFLPPATEELVNNPDTLGGGFNTHLVSATSHGEEVGARGTIGPDFYYDVAVFHLITHNDFGRFRVPARPLETFYANVGNSRRYGVEGFFSWHPVARLAVNLAYTYSNFKYTSYNLNGVMLSGTWLPNSPIHMANLDLQYDFARNWAVGLTTGTESKAWVDATNVPFIDGYTLVGLRLSRFFQAGGMMMELSAQARNLLGTKYIAFTEPDPDGNSYQPGPTQEFFITLRVWPAKD